MAFGSLNPHLSQIWWFFLLKGLAGIIPGFIEGQSSKLFKYWDKGRMATIGRNKAIADLKFVRLSGFLAWLCWLLIHLFFIVELRNRIVIFFQGAWVYITYKHGARLSYRPFRPVVPPKETG